MIYEQFYHQNFNIQEKVRINRDLSSDEVAKAAEANH